METPLYKKVVAVTSMKHLQHKMSKMLEDYEKAQASGAIKVVRTSTSVLTIYKEDKPVLAVIFVVVPVVVNLERLDGLHCDQFTRFDFTGVYRAIEDAKKRLKVIESPLEPFKEDEAKFS